MTYKGYNILVQKAGNGKVCGFIKTDNKIFSEFFAYFDSYNRCVKALQKEVDSYVIRANKLNKRKLLLQRSK